MRIVVADPDVSFSGPFRLFLQARGHEATTASDGLSCLTALRKDEPDVLAISSNLLWGGSEGVLTVMHEDHKLRNMPVLLMQEEGCDPGLRRHPMIISATRRPFGFDDLVSQLNFLAILGDEEAFYGKGNGASSAASAKLDLERAVWNA